MRTPSFSKQLFGYSLKDVDARVKQLQQSYEEARDEVEDLTNKLARLESQKEELAITVAAMRRQQIHVSSREGAGEPVTVLVGPTDSISGIANLIDALEGSPHLAVRFRVFRDGFYRVDGEAHDRTKLLGWLRAQSDVRELSIDQETVHVSPRGVSA